jgi:predicted RNA-binding Zn ribbon-like protein
MADVMEEAPGELETVRLFVNTLHEDLTGEELDTPEALQAWLARHGLADRRTPVRPADLRRAREVREALRRLMLANNGEELDGDAVETLNRTADRARVGAAFDDHASWRLEPAAGGVDRALGELLAIVFRSMSGGTWHRLKACHNPTCAYAFYDHSKNRSGRWCDMASCGNRAKARAYRERARKVSDRRR